MRLAADSCAFLAENLEIDFQELGDSRVTLDLTDQKYSYTTNRCRKDASSCYAGLNLFATTADSIEI